MIPSLRTCRIIFLGLSAVMLAACQENVSYDSTLTIRNTSDIDLTEKPIRIPKAQLETGYRDEQYPVLTTGQNDTVPSQLVDVDGDGNWDELFFLLDVEKSSSTSIGLNWVEHHRNWPERTYVRFGVRPSESDTVRPAIKDTFYPKELPGVMGYQPYQTDGPSWENDKVGF